MPCPSPSTRFIATETVQITARICLEFIHDPLRANLGFDDYMNVGRPHMCGQQAPASICAVPPQRLQNGFAPLAVKFIGRLRHPFALNRRTAWIVFQKAVARNIVIPIDGAGFAMKVRAVTRKSNEIPQVSLCRRRGSSTPATRSPALPALT